jgi:hypothetical protein
MNSAATLAVIAAIWNLVPSDLPTNYAGIFDPDPYQHCSGKLMLLASPVACTAWL